MFPETIVYFIHNILYYIHEHPKIHTSILEINFNRTSRYFNSFKTRTSRLWKFLSASIKTIQRISKRAKYYCANWYQISFLKSARDISIRYQGNLPVDFSYELSTNQVRIAFGLAWLGLVAVTYRKTNQGK